MGGRGQAYFKNGPMLRQTAFLQIFAIVWNTVQYANEVSNVRTI